MGRPRIHSNNAGRQAAYRIRTRQATYKQLSAKGLPPLPAIPTVPGWSRWTRAAEHAQSLIAQVREEMQAYFDDRLDEWQEGERGQEFEQVIERLDEALEAISSWRE